MDQPKKKGRPRKTQKENEEEHIQKKRGRKKKEKPEGSEALKEKKKRGRKATLKFFSSSIRKKMPLVSEIQDNDKHICYLDINEDTTKEEEVISLFDSDTNNTRNIQDEIKGNKYVYMSQYFSPNPNDSWSEKTNIHCWWCCHAFEDVPIGLPIYYDTSVHKFKTRGIFCSFPCIVAYDKENHKNKHKFFINSLYSKLTGTFDLPDDTKLNPAPPRYTLKMFGGNLTINQFRNASNENRVYRMVKYPMYISRDYIEEIDIKNLKTANKKLFSTQEHVPKTLIDTSKIQELRRKVKNTVIISSNSIDKFISID